MIPRTPAVLQAEHAECGLAALAIMMGHHGVHLPLEALRTAAGSTRLGTSATVLRRVGADFGFIVKAYRTEVGRFSHHGMPLIAHSRFIHFVVVEGIDGGEVVINDPAAGPVRVPLEEFEQDFTGVVLTVVPMAGRTRAGRPFSLARTVWRRLKGRRGRVAGAAALGMAGAGAAAAAALVAGAAVDAAIQARAPGWWCLGAGIAGGGALVLAGLADGWAQGAVAAAARSLGVGVLERLHHLPAAYVALRSPAAVDGKLSAAAGLTARGRMLVSLRPLAGPLAAVPAAAMIDPWAAAALALAVSLDLGGFFRLLGRRGDAFAGAEPPPAPVVGWSERIVAEMEHHRIGGGEAELFTALAGHHAAALHTAQRIRATGDRLALWRDGVVAAGAVGVVAALATGMASGRLTPGDGVALLLLAGIGMAATGRAVRRFRPRLLARDLLALDDLEAAAVEPERAVQVSRDGKPGLMVRDLGWRPWPGAPWLFTGLTLTLNAGEHMVVLGAASSGKSVLARLLTGIVRPDAGTIRLDGRDPAAGAGGAAVLLDHRPMILAGTVRDNLRLGRALDDDALLRALADAGLEPELAARGGLDLPLPLGGLELSGGQRRRLALAAALAGSPRLLVIDEALDSIDPSQEWAIRSALRRRGIAVVLITRREGNLHGYDHTLRLGEG